MAYFAGVVWPGDQNCHPTGPWDWPPNVWAGTSVESAKYLPRLDVLARVPAKVRFVSCEPLLGPLDLRRYLPCAECGGTGGLDPKGREGYCITEAACPACFLSGRGKGSVRWVIAGGESGAGARPTHPDWLRSIRDQCQEAAVPFFFKQWGEWMPTPDNPHAHLVSSDPDGGPSWWRRMSRVGKKAGGAMLDDRTWEGMP